MVAKLLPYSVKKILHYQLKPKVSRGSVGVTVGVSVRGSVDTTLTPAEYIVFKGFSDNNSILGVGVDKVSSYSMFFEGVILIF